MIVIFGKPEHSRWTCKGQSNRLLCGLYRDRIKWLESPLKQTLKWSSTLSWDGLPRWFSVKESTCQCRRHGFDPWIRKISWRGNGNPLQYSCLRNPMNRGAWWACKQSMGLQRVRHDLATKPPPNVQLNNLQCANRTFTSILSLGDLFPNFKCGEWP